MFGKALIKGLDILERLRAADDGRLAFSALRERVEAAPASFARFLKILVERGYVTRESSGTYRLGWQLAEHGRAALETWSLQKLARPRLRLLVEATGESAEAAVFDDGHFIFVDRAESTRSVVLKAQAGSRFGVSENTALGLLALAFDLPGNKGAASGAQLAAIRREGFAQKLQNNEEVYRAAAAVRDCAGVCTGCLCIAAPAFRVGRGEKARFKRLLTEQARDLSRELA
ncbi:MAG: helix-turn-helix domain-containing protein [Kiritimatiellae bacterium]|nr:helix-turn-helix domain-containing protein [Kiritimatiellia bacterium]